MIGGNGSINHSIKHRIELETLCGSNNYLDIPVKCTTYKQIIKDLNIDKLELFVLDVEGNEFNVIDGMIGCDILPDVFVIEHGHTNIDIITDKLKILNNNYKLDFVSYVNSYYIKI